MTTQTRRRLVHLERNKRHTAPTVRLSTTLPPRAVFEGNPETLEAYDAFTAMVNARQERYREAHKLRSAATAGRTEYKRAVREALGGGKAVDKITDPHDHLIEQASAHEDLAREAEAELITLGNALGEAISRNAPDLFEPSEKVMEAAAARVQADIESLRQSWTEWAGAWQVRRILSEAAHYGGLLSNYDPNASLPADVAAALEAIDTRLHDLDVLLQDEHDLKAWREQETRADASNKTHFGQSDDVYA